MDSSCVAAPLPLPLLHAAVVVVFVLIIAINFGMSGVVNEFLGHFLARHAML